MGLDGADQHAGALHAAQHRFEQEGGCGLAVSAGHGAQRQAMLGMLHHRCAGFGQGSAAMLHQSCGYGWVFALQLIVGLA